MTRAVGFLIFPNFQLLDAAGPIAAFEIAGLYGQGAYQLHVLAREAGRVASSSGATMEATAMAEAPVLDTLVVAGGMGTRDPETVAAVADQVRAAAAATRRVTSVCSGAFILAEAGLLDGRRATTHWSRTAGFAQRYPRVKLEPDRIYVKDGPVWSSAGITAGIDLSLALIAEDLGEDIARRCAQQLVVYHRRPGGQSQFSALLEMDRPEGRFGGLMGWIRERAARAPGRRAAGRPRGHEPAELRARLRGGDRRHTSAGGRALKGRGGAGADRSRPRADRAHRPGGRLRRAGADAAGVSARLRSTAPGAAAQRAGGVDQEEGLNHGAHEGRGGSLARPKAGLQNRLVALRAVRTDPFVLFVCSVVKALFWP